MLRISTSVAARCGGRSFSTSASRNVRVTIVGAAGGIGQPLAMMLKLSPLVTQLNLYDLMNVNGVAADLSHIETKAVVKGFTGQDKLDASLEGAQLVLIPAGLPRKPGMTRQDLFSKNASIVFDVAERISNVCRDAFVGIITNPVNSTVPIAAEVFKSRGIDNWRRLFGITTLDVVRSNAFVAEAANSDVSKTNVPVIGGHSGDTIVPLLSQVHFGGSGGSLNLQPADRAALVKRIQNAGTEVVNAKAGAGSATLSMAFAGARFAGALTRAITGKEGKEIVECAYVANKGLVNLPYTYFAMPLALGKEGVVGSKFTGIDKLDKFEQSLMTKCDPELKANIAEGEKFARERLNKK